MFTKKYSQNIKINNPDKYNLTENIVWSSPQGFDLTMDIYSQKNTSDSEIIKLRAKQIELQTALDKVQQEFYSFGADISRTEQEISLKKMNT